MSPSLNTQKVIKYACFGFSAAYITVVLFLGMLSLLQNHNDLRSGDTLDFRISYINIDDSLALKKRQIKKPEKQPKATKPPAMPRMQMTNQEIKLSASPDSLNFGYNLKAFEHSTMNGPNLNFGMPQNDSLGGVKAALPPIYPPKALYRDKEGWVEVLVSVNQMGMVDDVVVLDAEPADIFNEAALKAVHKWSFYPKTVNGVPLPYKITQTIEFKIDQIEE